MKHRLTIKRKNLKQAGRFFLLVVLPLFLSIFWLFSPFEKIPIADITSLNETTYIISSEDVFKPSLKTSLRDIFNTPFDFRWYHFCIEDHGSHAEYTGRPAKEEFVISVKFGDGGTIQVNPRQSKDCKLIQFNKEFEFTRGLYIEGDVVETVIAALEAANKGDEDVFSFKIESEVYIKPELSGLIVKTILFCLSWIVMVFLISKISSFIRA